LFIERRLEGVKTTFTFAGVEDFLRPLFLDEKTIRMKFKVSIVITS
jgi:hypothetical protein